MRIWSNWKSFFHNVEVGSGDCILDLNVVNEENEVEGDVESNESEAEGDDKVEPGVGMGFDSVKDALEFDKD